MNTLTQKQIEEWFYRSPTCPHCRKFDNFKIIFVLVLALLSAYLLYTLQDDMESECCKAVKKINERVAKQSEGYGYYFPDKNEEIHYNNSIIFAND